MMMLIYYPRVGGSRHRYANERLLRAQQREERQKAWEAGQAERKEREERRKEWERENAPEPFDKEVTACEQLVSYLSKFVMPAEVAPAAVQVSERSGFHLVQKPDHRPRAQRTRRRLSKRTQRSQ
jgi:hypothetical protein